MVDYQYQVGTSNLNRRSLFQDLEADRFILEDENKRLLENDFEDVLKKSKEVKWASYPGLEGALQRWICWIFRLWL